MKTNIIKNLKRTINRIKPIPVKNAKNLKMQMDIAEDYLKKAYCPTGGNTTGGMLRGSTLHLKSFEREVKYLEEQGFNVDKYKKEALSIRECYNSFTLRHILELEDTHYEKELIVEGFLTETYQ